MKLLLSSRRFRFVIDNPSSVARDWALGLLGISPLPPPADMPLRLAMLYALPDGLGGTCIGQSRRVGRLFFQKSFEVSC